MWDIIGAVLLFALVLPVAIEPISLDGLSHGPSIPGVAVAVLMCGAVAIRRLSPALSLLVTWVGGILQMAFQLPPLAVNVALYVVLFSVAAYGSRLVMWLGLASAGAAGLIATPYLVLPSLLFDGGTTGQTPPIEAQLLGSVIMTVVLFSAIAGTLALAWLAGLLLRTRLHSRRLEQERVVTAALASAEAERVQIARDMHDVVAHSLAVVIAQADGARYASAADPQIATDALRTISATARGALSDVRLLLTQLRHSQGTGPQPTLADLEGLYAQVRGAGVDLRVDVDPMPQGDPPGAIQLAVYRILQEALTNALRHGDGAGVDIHLGWLAQHVDITVRNGIAPGEHTGGGGHGLIGMRERAQLVGGTLDAAATDGQFFVHAVIPMPPEDSDD